jgi:Cu/Zn superoxide dismutase
VRVDLRNAPAGEFVLTLNENPDCRADEVDGAVVYGAKAGPAWGPEGGQVRMPSLQATPEGAIKAEFLIRGLAIADTRDRSFVLTAGGRRVACGISI